MVATKLTVQQNRNAKMDVVRQKLSTVKERLFEGAPRHISPNRMITSAMMAFRDNPKLLECTMDSQLASIRQAAFYGWEIGGPLAQAYLVPYKDTCTLIPGYRGLIEHMRHSGEVMQIDTEVVHACDRFRVIKGDDARIEHEPSDDPSRKEHPVTAVYVIVHLKGGARQRSVWTAAEINYHKERHSEGWKRAEANGKKDSPWHKHWETMAFKTIIVSMIKRGLVPVSAEIRESLDKDESVSAMLAPQPALETTVTDRIVTPEPEQIAPPPAIDDREAAIIAAKERIDACQTPREVADAVTSSSQGMDPGDVDEIADYGIRRSKALGKQ